MNEHPLHEEIGQELIEMNLESTGCRPVLDAACDSGSKKKQQISLFVQEKNLENRLCKVDAIIIKQENGNDAVKIIIEIEESSFLPTKICGKYLTSAIAGRYVYKGKTIPIHKNSVLFIQVIDLPKLLREKDKSKKKEQLEIIRNEINKKQIGCIKQYELIFMDRNNQKDFDKFRDVIEKYLNI